LSSNINCITLHFFAHVDILDDWASALRNSAWWLRLQKIEETNISLHKKREFSIVQSP
jgi:hypothetical protein